MGDVNLNEYRHEAWPQLNGDDETAFKDLRLGDFVPARGYIIFIDHDHCVMVLDGSDRWGWSIQEASSHKAWDEDVFWGVRRAP